MPNYVFKFTPEAVWALVTTLTAVVSQYVLASAQPTDWRVWAIGLGAAAGRALIGFVLSQTGPVATP